MCCVSATLLHLQGPADGLDFVPVDSSDPASLCQDLVVVTSLCFSSCKVYNK